MAAKAIRQLNRVLGGFARHPNIGGYVLIGLGCETGHARYLLDDQKLVQIGGSGGAQARRPPVLSMQDVGGTTKTIDAARPAGRRNAAAGQRRAPRADSAQRIDPGHQLRRLRRQLGHHRQSCPGRGQRHARRRRRHVDPGRNDRNLRRRAVADPPGPHAGRSARSWSSASAGGSGTPACSAARSTTIPRPATRKAG